jgi:hypothetical protein
LYTKPNAPRSIGGIIDDAIRLYREAFAKSVVLSLLAQLALAVPMIMLRSKMIAMAGQAPVAPRAGVFGAITANQMASFAAFKSPAVLLSYCLAVLLVFGLNNAMIWRIDRIANANIEPLGQSVAVGLRLLPRTVLLYLAIFAAAMGAALILGILVAIMAHLAKGVPAVQIVLFSGIAVLTIYAWGRLALAHIALVVDDAGAVKSMSISWQLIKGYWWRAATVYGVAIIMLMAFYFVLGVVNAVIAVALRGSLGTGMIASQIVSIVGGTLLMAFIPAVLLCLYYDLKLRKEGADLEGRVNALAPR